MWIVISGNPIDGCSFYGPFKTRDQANDWADRNVANEYDWWVTNLEEPT